VDYIFRWLGMTFLPGYREANKGLANHAPPGATAENGETAAEAEQQPAAKMVGGLAVWQGLASPDAADNFPLAELALASPNSAKAAAGSWQTPGADGAAARPAAIAGGFAESGRAGVRGAVDGAIASLPLSNRMAELAFLQADAPSCEMCGAIAFRSGSCYVCYSCGHSMGCS